MNHSSIAEITHAIAPVIKDAIAAGIEPLTHRIQALEDRQPEKGEKGDPGENGHHGIDGTDGAPGKDGFDGLAGKDGAPGLDGKDGAAGINGRDGIDGKDGAPGRDGINGVDGRDGVDGKDGAPGRDGIDGKDGAPGKDGTDAPALTTEQIARAIKALGIQHDIDTLISSALTAEAHKGGIDVLAPDSVVQEMRNAVLLLAEPAPVKRAIDTEVKSAAPSKPRTFRFDRDAQNRIVAAHEEFEDAQ